MKLLLSVAGICVFFFAIGWSSQSEWCCHQEEPAERVNHSAYSAHPCCTAVVAVRKHTSLWLDQRCTLCNVSWLVGGWDVSAGWLAGWGRRATSQTQFSLDLSPHGLESTLVQTAYFPGHILQGIGHPSRIPALFSQAGSRGLWFGALNSATIRQLPPCHSMFMFVLW